MCLVLSELKSSLDSCDILKAYRQIVFTYLKLHMMMSVCEGFDISNWEIIGIIACLPPKNEDQKTKLQLELLNMEEGNNEIKPDIKCFVQLFFKKKIESGLADTPFTKGKPLHEKLKDMKISICLKTANSTTDSETELNLNSLT